MLQALQRPIRFLIANPTQDVLFRELAGNNLPHALIMRNKDEFVDTAVNEFGGTGFFFGLGYGLNHLLNKSQAGLAKTLTTPQQGWLQAGRSMMILPAIAGVLTALPFIRNSVSARRTQTTDFLGLIKEPVDAAAPGPSKDEVRQWSNKQLMKAGAIVLTGLAASALSVPLTRLAIKQHWSFGPTTQKLFNTLGLGQGQFKNMSEASSMLWWAVPSFGGLIAASRDRYERKEDILQLGAFVASFVLMPNLMKNAVGQRLMKGFSPQLQETASYAAKFLTSTVLCSATPSLMNIALTHRRVKHQQHQPPPESLATMEATDHPPPKGTTALPKGKSPYAHRLESIDVNAPTVPASLDHHSLTMLPPPPVAVSHLSMPLLSQPAFQAQRLPVVSALMPATTPHTISAALTNPRFQFRATPSAFASEYWANPQPRQSL